jgi:hypothetical protein
MNQIDIGLASSRRAHAFFKSQHPMEVKPMSTLDQTNADRQRRRLLVPLNASDESRWAIAYALRLHRRGELLEVILLNVGEPVDAWQVLRFRTQLEVADFQSARAQAFIADASRPLIAENAAWRGVFRRGERLFAILDAAEEFACDEIVVPAPKKGIAQLFSPDFVTLLERAQRDVPVVTVDSDGDTAPCAVH